MKFCVHVLPITCEIEFFLSVPTQSHSPQHTSPERQTLHGYPGRRSHISVEQSPDSTKQNHPSEHTRHLMDDDDDDEVQ